MPDVHSPEQRSRNMAAIRSKNTKPELYFRKLLFARGYRYRLNVSRIPGKPDLFLRKYRTAIFINGCFWHRHAGCRYCTTPGTNQEFWEKKFARNVARDAEVHKQLEEAGIKCLVIWECVIKKMKKDEQYRNRILDRVDNFLKSSKEYEDIGE